ncbi:hypothetical protein ES703_109650 [subsurface metagenome]
MIDIFNCSVVSSRFIFDFVSFVLSPERKDVASQLVVELAVEEHQGIYCVSVGVWILMASVIRVSFRIY